MPKNKQEANAYLLALYREYDRRFGHCIGIPFGHDEFTDDDLIREYEIALETGIPFEPGTQRWLDRFGPQRKTPEGIVI